MNDSTAKNVTPNDVAKKLNEPAQDANESSTNTPLTAANPAVDGSETKDGERGVDYWKAKARKWEDRAKANSERLKKLDEIEEAEKTQAEKDAETIADLQRRLAEQDAEAKRSQVIAEHAVPKPYWHLVVGDDEAELVKAAQSVAELLKGRSGIVEESSTTGGKPKNVSNVQAGRERYAARFKKNGKE